MTPLRCLITGADFLDTENERWIHGDLHQLFDALILDATGCQWYDLKDRPLSDGALVVRADYHYEKNSQIVFTLQDAMFNDHANRYLTEMLNKEGKENPMVMVIDLGGLGKL
jgi:hypothetical protein